MILLTPTASTSAPYPDADLSPWPRSFSADWADTLSAERLSQALDATAESLLPQTPRCAWGGGAPEFWFAEDADFETEETFPVNSLDEANNRRKRARSEEEGECDEEEEEEGARSEEEGEYYCREEATPRPPPSPITPRRS